MGYAKEKEKISMPRSMGKRKKEKEKENKDSPYLKIKESCRKRCEFHLEKFHTHAHLDLIV